MSALAYILRCLLTTVSSAHCRVVRTVSTSVNKAVLIVVNITAKLNSKRPLVIPPSPTRTTPLFLPPSPTTPCSHSPPWTLWLALLGALTLALVAAVLVKIGAFKRAREKIAEVLQVRITNFKRNVLRVFVVACIIVNAVDTINSKAIHGFAMSVLFIGNYTVKLEVVSYRLTIHVVASAIVTANLVQAFSPIAASKVAAAAHVVHLLPDPWVLLFPVSTLRIRPATPLGSRHWQVVAFPGVDNHIDISALTWIRWLGRGASGQVAKLKGASGTLFAVKRMEATETWRSEAAVHVAMRDHPAFPVLHGVYRAQAHRFFVMVRLFLPSRPAVPNHVFSLCMPSGSTGMSSLCVADLFFSHYLCNACFIVIMCAHIKIILPPPAALDNH
ncbi:hypothetical protein C8R43DRAFT_1169797 [Mycena crocata]|nr:hypothetical protein C8R43DRAFT_1169797 [Mycena crocata]